MTSGPHLRLATPPAPEPPQQTPRLKLKPKAPATGHVDGAWWPRTRDLSTELPALLEALAAQLGRIQRVTYNLTTWDGVPRRLHIDGRQVRLGGFHAQHPHTVDVIGLHGPRLTLLVVPPETNRATAEQILMTAARQHNIDGIDDLLTPTAEPSRPTADDLPDNVIQRWEIDGGHIHARA